MILIFTRKINLVPRALVSGFGGGKSVLGTRLTKNILLGFCFRSE